MLNRDMRGGFTTDAGRQNEVTLPQAKRATAGEAGKNRYVENTDGDDCVDR